MDPLPDAQNEAQRKEDLNKPVASTDTGKSVPKQKNAFTILMAPKAPDPKVALEAKWEAERKEDLKKPVGTTIIPFDNNEWDPAQLVGLHVTGVSSEDYAYPWEIHVQEHEEPIEIELSNGGRYHGPTMDVRLRTVLRRATKKRPLQILEGVVGQRRTKVKWPASSHFPDMRGKTFMEEYRLVGLRLEGMDKIGWIWGQDEVQEFYNCGLYSAAVVMATKEVREAQGKERAAIWEKEREAKKMEEKAEEQDVKADEAKAGEQEKEDQVGP